MRREIRLGEQLIRYEFTRKRVKNINLRVRGDGSVCVSAPVRVSVATVEQFLRSREGFILRAVEQAERRAQPKSGCVGYLGGELRLCYEPGPRFAARREGESLCLTLKDPGDENACAAALERWKKEESCRIMTAMLEETYPSFAPYGVPKPTLRFRQMRSRWGSCMPKKGVVTLNTRLLAYPKDCMEYILIHELCHFLQADHSTKFYAWMDHFLPNWREKKREIER